jgi:hypothetical protein
LKDLNIAKRRTDASPTLSVTLTETLPEQSEGIGQPTATVEINTAGILVYLPIRQLKFRWSKNLSPYTVINVTDPGAIMEGRAYNVLGLNAVPLTSTISRGLVSITIV